MAHKVIDRCKETTSTTGTGTLTLTGAVANFVAMADATQGLTADGDTSWFCAENGAEWEVFLGTRVDATHLARAHPPISSSNAGAAVSFTAAPTVFGTVPASKLSAVGPSFSAYRATSTQALTSGVAAKVQFNAEEFDNGNCFDSTTNYRWTPNVAGYYQVSGAVNINAASGVQTVQAYIYKNGANIAIGSYVPGVSTTDTISTVSRTVYMNGTTDYLELWVYSNGTSPVVAFTKGTYFTAYMASLPGAPMLAPIVAPGPSFCAYRSTDQTGVPNTTYTKVAFNAEEFDNGSCFDSTTNGRFQPNVEGYYDVSWAVTCDGTTLTVGNASLYKNGALAAYGVWAAASSSITISSGATTIYMNGTTDYLEVFAYISAASGHKFRLGAGSTRFAAHLAALPQVPQPTSGPAFHAYLSSAQTGIVSGTWTKIALNTEEFDAGGCYDNVTNYRFTPNVAGYYHFSFLLFSSSTTLSNPSMQLRKNGTSVGESAFIPVSSVAQRTVGSRLVYMNGTTDYVELWGYLIGTGLQFSSGAAETSLSGHWVRPG